MKNKQNQIFSIIQPVYFKSVKKIFLLRIRCINIKNIIQYFPVRQTNLYYKFIHLLLIHVLLYLFFYIILHYFAHFHLFYLYKHIFLHFKKYKWKNL